MNKVWFLSSRNLKSKKVDTSYLWGAATIYEGVKAGILKRIWKQRDKGHLPAWETAFMKVQKMVD